MNKLKDYLRLKMLGQLSDFNTELDVNNAYDVCKEFIMSFLIFLRENYSTLDPDYPYECLQLTNDFWQDLKTEEVVHTSKIFNMFIESYDKKRN